MNLNWDANALTWRWNSSPFGNPCSGKYLGEEEKRKLRKLDPEKKRKKKERKITGGQFGSFS